MNPHPDGRHPPDTRVDPVDASESLQQLIDLGCIEAVDEDRGKAAENTVKELRYNLARDLMDSGHHDQAIPILDELWEAHQDESRFGTKLFDCALAMGQHQQARETLKLLSKSKQDYASKALEELKTLQAGWPDEKPPEDIPENEARRLRKLRKQATSNRRSLAFFRGRLLRAEGRNGEALAMLEQAARAHAAAGDIEAMSDYLIAGIACAPAMSRPLRR